MLVTDKDDGDDDDNDDDDDNYVNGDDDDEGGDWRVLKFDVIKNKICEIMGFVKIF